jgi:hypothetical protein
MQSVASAQTSSQARSLRLSIKHGRDLVDVDTVFDHPQVGVTRASAARPM